MKSYNLLRIGQLLYTTGAIKGKEKVLNSTFTVVAHTLPFELARFGVLGMDFLRTAKTRIDVFNAQAFIRNL